MGWNLEFDPSKESVIEYRDRLLLTAPILSGAERDVLRQCQKATWDGNLASKSARSSLLQKGLIVKFGGWQIASREGLAVLDVMGALKS